MVRRSVGCGWGMALATALTSSNVRAGTDPSLAETTPQRVLGVPDYLEIVLVQTSEGWVNGGGSRRAVTYTGLMELGVRLDLDAADLIPGGAIGLIGLFLQGSNISAKAVHDAGPVSNLAGVQTLRLFSAWYEHTMFDRRVALKAGIIPLDDDFTLLDSAQLFINSGFGLLQTIPLNIPTPVYPLGALGARFRIAPADSFAIHLGVYDGDAGVQRDDRYVSDLGFTRDAGVTLIGEASWRAEEAHAALGAALQVDAGDLLAVAYVMLEHRLARVGGGALTGFAHASVALPSRRAIASAYADVGVVLAGALWGRAEDRVGLGLTWTRFDRVYLRRTPGVTDAEWVLELTYELVVLPWLTVQPTVQGLLDPHFGGSTDAIALAVRVSAGF